MPLGCRDWDATLARRPGRARRRGPDAARRRRRRRVQPRVRRLRARRCRRLSTLIDENTLAGSGAENTHGICAAAAYFETLATPESLDFGWRYTKRFGPDAPTLNSVGESCYEGILRCPRSPAAPAAVDVRRMTAVAEALSYAGPRGEVSMRERHLDQRVYLAEANDVRLDVVAQL